MQTKHPGYFNQSITRQLIASVFGLYCLVAIGLTLTHIIIEYKHTKSLIAEELKTNQQIFEPVLSSALWDLDMDQLTSALEGMLQVPIITGVLIEQDGNQILARGNVVNQSDLTEPTAMNQDLFSYQFPIQYLYNNNTLNIGSTTLYSDSSVIMERMELGIALLIINALLKSIALWIIFLWLGKKLLLKPLKQMLIAIEEVNFDRLEDIHIDLETSKQNELGRIEHSFKDMTDHLIEAKNNVLDFNQKLEINVEQRTTELKLAKELAEQASQAKSTLMARVSHELRTPLNAIIGFSSMQLKKMDDTVNERLRFMSERVNSAGKHLLVMVNDIIDSVQLEKAQFHLNSQQVPLQELIEECISLVHFNAIEQDITITPTPTSHLAIGDPARILQILVNLLTNAIKYNHHAGSINIDVSATDDWVTIAVIDNGIGIKDDDQKKIFENFIRLEYAEDNAIAGIGIGLALSKHLAKNMGGDIKVDSQLGEGSTFTLQLPRGHSQSRAL